MSESIHWVLAVQIHEGQQEAFKAISAKLIESTQNEPDALSYEWSLSDDGLVCHIFERYKNSTAIGLHIERNGAMVGNLFNLVTPLSFVIYGDPDEKIREALADLNPVYMTHLGGFTR